MPPIALFCKYDVYAVLEDKKRRIKEAYRRLPDDQALDDAFIKDLKSQYMMDVPVLRVDEMTYEEHKTQVDARRQSNRIFFANTGPVLEDALQLVIHIPFDGDPGVFTISPSGTNGRVAEGEILGQELLLRVTVIDANYDVQGHIDREVKQINWALTHLREKEAYFDEQLTGALAGEVQNRRRTIESRASVTGRLNIPLRQSPMHIAPKELPSSPKKAPPMPKPPKWDVFVSHATEDKPYVDPLVAKLEAEGVSVWYDRLVMDWGDDLRTKIDNGLINCNYGIVVLSKAFLGKKKWTEYELNSLFAREQAGQKLVLPIWHGVRREDLLQYSPMLADRIAKITDTDSYDDIVAALKKLLGKEETHKSTSPSTKPDPPVTIGETISYAKYYGPDGKRISLFVRASGSNGDLFVFEDADGKLEQGSIEEIAMKYLFADRKLTMNGYKRDGFLGSGKYPQFNL